MLMRTVPLLMLCSLFLLGGCTAYVPDIQQGNVLEPEQVKKLTIGMSRKQVSFLLGAPLLQDPFHRDRWDYVYTLKKRGEPLVQQRLTLYFKSDSLEKIDDSQLEKKTLNN